MSQRGVRDSVTRAGLVHGEDVAASLYNNIVVPTEGGQKLMGQQAGHVLAASTDFFNFKKKLRCSCESGWF